MGASVDYLPALINRGSHALRAELFGMIHARRDTRPFIRNVCVDVEMLRIDDLILPATVDHGAPGNAWICSPRATYCNGMAEQVRSRCGPVLARCGAGLFSLFGRALDRACIDRAVILNNWLTDTCFYPHIRPHALARVIDAALQRWPQHALWFRSLNAERNGALIAALRGAGFVLIPTRRVWLFDGIGMKLRMGSILQRDLKFLHRTPLWPVARSDIYPADFPRIAMLHGLMQGMPEGWPHPHYTAHFMQYWHQAGLLDFRGFRDDDGLLQAVAGVFRMGDMISAPILGCNPSAPRPSGLFRLLMTRLLEEAMLTNATLCLGPGHGEYKRRRGGRAVLEYSAVLARHLPPQARRTVALLEGAVNRVGLSALSRY